MCRWLSVTHQARNVSLRHYSYAIMGHHPLQLFLPVCHCVSVCVCEHKGLVTKVLVYLSLSLISAKL